jgi:RhtB (resistance to homoserine/threonine) family protein
MLAYLPQILTVALVHFLALMSPGPDFILITRNSLLFSKRSGIYTALGLSFGMLLHITYSLVGIGFIIAKSIVLFSILKFLGAGYLIFIGYKSLKAPKQSKPIEGAGEEVHLTKFKALRMGFLTNATNPKVTLFFLSIFTLVVNPATPLYVKLIMGGEMMAATFAWFSIVALIVSHRAIKKRVHAFQHYAEKTMGVLLIALGLRLAISTSR